MAQDHRSDDQESLFTTDNTDEQAESVDSGTSGDHHSDLSFEEERLRNGDISFRPVSLPGSDPEPADSRGGTGGTALMIIAAIVVVILLTYVIYTFYSPSHSGSEEAAVVEPEDLPIVPLEQPVDQAEESEEPAAIFRAHAELQENYRRSEVRISELEAELDTLRNAGPAATPTTGSVVDQDRLERLEEENRGLNADLERQRRDSETAVSRAEKLVQRAEAGVTEERNRSRAARQEAEALAGEKNTLTTELDAQKTRVSQLEAELAQRAATTTTRQEGESEAVRQLMSRHAEELERERKVTREKEAEVLRLKGVIARISVEEPASGTPTRTAQQSGSTAASATASADGTLSPPRLLTRTVPEYPMNARRLRVEGTVLLNGLVGTDGKVREVKVVEADGGKLLSPAAVDAVRKWTYSPATRGGQPVECWHKVPIKFAL
jgi:TonB family protein